jgi:hypothetical protein
MEQKFRAQRDERGVWMNARNTLDKTFYASDNGRAIGTRVSSSLSWVVDESLRDSPKSATSARRDWRPSDWTRCAVNVFSNAKG